MENCSSNTKQSINKKGDKLSTSNYRAISHESITRNLIEGIISEELESFATKNSVLPQDQHLIVKGKSTTSGEQCVTYWSKSYDKKVPTDVTYLDFS